MKDVTIIFGFRDRELLRVERCLNSLANQTDHDFMVIFVDYGSNSDTSSEVEKLVSNYSFCSYIKSYTEGMFWNRSHALNTGIKLSSSQYTITSDIDLIFPCNFISRIKENLAHDLEVHYPAYDLGYKFKNWNSLHSKKTTFGTKRGNTALGLVQGVNTSILKEIRGFDEYFCVWGAEDEDLNRRLLSKRIETKWHELKPSPIYHQWHQSSGKRSFNLPARWQEYLIGYMEKSVGQIVRNDSQNWGKIVSEEERPALNLYGKKDNLVSFNLGDLPVQLVSSSMEDQLKNLKKGEYVYFRAVDKWQENIENSRLVKWIDRFNSFSNRNGLPILLQNDISFFNQHQSITQYRDMIYYFILEKRVEFHDYYLNVASYELDLIIVK